MKAYQYLHCKKRKDGEIPLKFKSFNFPPCRVRKELIDLLFDQVPFLRRGIASGIDQDLGLISTLVEDCKFSCWWWRGAFDSGDADAVSTLLADGFGEVGTR